MRRKRSRAANAAAGRHKSAKRQIKRKHRFIQYGSHEGGVYYEDIVTGKSYPGVMPAVLRGHRVQETP
jgi:hypothetical protein